MSTKSNNEFIFRGAEVPDIKTVQQMIQELADFEKLTDGPNLTEEELINDAGLNGGRDYCHIYILELKGDSTKAPVAIGYAIGFFTYSTCRGKAYFLEDIYVRPNYRNTGAGAYMFRQIAAKAKANNCKRVDFHVLAWNPARSFYKHMGATDITEKEDWHYYRVEEGQIEKLASELIDL